MASQCYDRESLEILENRTIVSPEDNREGKTTIVAPEMRGEVIEMPAPVRGDDSVLFEDEVNVNRIIEELRVERLLHYRKVFLLASLAFALVALVATIGGSGYEPAVAMFLSVFGIYVVFQMKVADARGR